MADNFRVLLSDSLASQGIEVFKRYPRISVEAKAGLSRRGTGRTSSHPTTR